MHKNVNFLTLFFLNLNFLRYRLVFDRLMNRLGFNRYYVQGGDWGAIIGTAMSTLFPERYLQQFFKYY